MAELQHKTPRKPRRTNLRRLPGWHRTGEIFYAVGFLTEYWLICLGRKAAAACNGKHRIGPGLGCTQHPREILVLEQIRHAEIILSLIHISEPTRRS